MEMEKRGASAASQDPRREAWQRTYANKETAERATAASASVAALRAQNEAAAVLGLGDKNSRGSYPFIVLGTLPSLNCRRHGIWRWKFHIQAVSKSNTGWS
jgi:hypothetical protein